MHGVVTVLNYYVLLLMLCLCNPRLTCAVTRTCGESAPARQGVPADLLASGGPAAELRHWTTLVKVKTEVKRTICG